MYSSVAMKGKNARVTENPPSHQMCIVNVKYKCENFLNLDHLNLARLLYHAIPCNVLALLKGK